MERKPSYKGGVFISGSIVFFLPIRGCISQTGPSGTRGRTPTNTITGARLAGQKEEKNKGNIGDQAKRTTGRKLELHPELSCDMQLAWLGLYSSSPQPQRGLIAYEGAINLLTVYRILRHKFKYIHSACIQTPIPFKRKVQVIAVFVAICDLTIAIVFGKIL